MGKFKKVFRGLPDPRADNAQHELADILFIALAALLCGAETSSDMAEFGLAKEEFFRRILVLKHGIPSHDTFSRVFRLLDPQAFAATFRQFMAAFAEANKLDLSGVVAIDGKALRGAFERGRQATPLHMVNVWAADARMVLAQRKAPGRNEVAGALELLGLLSLDGCVVTADALHCHRAMAIGVLGRGGHLRVGAQGESVFVVCCRPAQLCTRGQRQRHRTARTFHPRSPRAAARYRHSRYDLGCRTRLPGHCCGGTHHLSPTAARWPHRAAGRTLLPAFPIRSGQDAAARPA